MSYLTREIKCSHRSLNIQDLGNFGRFEPLGYEQEFRKPHQPNQGIRSDGVPYLAAGLGFEPRYHPPEGRVLPLDDPAIYCGSENGKVLTKSWFLPLDDPAMYGNYTKL